MATELDTFIKARQLGLIPDAHYFILAPRPKISNPHLLAYWRQYFKVITNPLLCFVFIMLTRRYFALYSENLHRVKFFGTQEIYRINKLWGERSPLLALTQADEEWAEASLIQLGIERKRWFVCLHVREGGFLPHNEAIQAHRNASVENTFLAISEVVRRGGVVVRMGDPSMVALPPLEGVIDYARHPLKSDRMDVVLCAKAKFFLGCTSGLAFLSMIFGVPIAHANMIPVETLGLRHCDLSIPKLIWDERQKRYLHFDEILSSEIGGYFFTHQYEKAGLRVEENSPEDIKGLVHEILARIDGNHLESLDEKDLQTRYLALFKPGHYSYGAASKVGTAFLQQHRTLLEPKLGIRAQLEGVA